MAKTPAQRGPFGRWLTRVRQERYATQRDALSEMERLAGLKIAPSEYAQWEAGSRTPREDNPKIHGLYEFFGSRPEDLVPPEAAPAAEMAALVVAMTHALEAQARVNVRLAESLEAAREEARQGRAETMDLLAGLAAELRALRDAAGTGDGAAAESPAAPVP